MHFLTKSCCFRVAVWEASSLACHKAQEMWMNTPSTLIALEKIQAIFLYFSRYVRGANTVSYSILNNSSVQRISENLHGRFSVVDVLFATEVSANWM